MGWGVESMEEGQSQDKRGAWHMQEAGVREKERGGPFLCAACQAALL